MTAAGVKRTPGLGSNPDCGTRLSPSLASGCRPPKPPHAILHDPESTGPGHGLRPRPGVGTRLTGLADEDLDGRAGRALADGVVGREGHLVAPVFLQVCKGDGDRVSLWGPLPYGHGDAIPQRGL